MCVCGLQDEKPSVPLQPWPVLCGENDTHANPIMTLKTKMNLHHEEVLWSEKELNICYILANVSEQ